MDYSLLGTFLGAIAGGAVVILGNLFVIKYQTSLEAYKQSIPKEQDSAERTYGILVTALKSGKLTPDLREKLIITSFWLPKEERKAILKHVILPEEEDLDAAFKAIQDFRDSIEPRKPSSKRRNRPWKKKISI